MKGRELDALRPLAPANEPDSEAPPGLHSLVAAAHELKAPLALMRHLAQSLSGDIALTPAEQRDYLQRLQLTAERSLRFVQHLTFSYRLEANAAQLPFAFPVEPVSVNSVCQEALHDMAPYATQHHQELRLTGLKCPHLALANRDVLHDIVMNLVDNAIKHSAADGVVQIVAECRGEQVRLLVRDSGANALPSELQKLQHTLGRQPQPLTGRAGSSGLGLYIVQQFAQSMGGRLGVGRSTDGAIFFVDLLRSRQLSLFV